MKSGASFYGGVFAILLGVAATLLGFVGFATATLLFVAAIACIVGAHIRREKYFLLVTLVLALMSVSIIRADIFVKHFFAQNILAFASNQKITIVGRVIGDPDRRETTTHATVAVASIGGMPARGNVVTYLPPDVAIAYGDRVEMEGLVEAPQSFAGDAGNEFDYPHYLEVQNISAVVSGAKISSTSASGLTFFGALYSLRQTFDASIVRLFPRPTSALLSGMLFGERRALSPELEALLVSVGLIHIVILAGYALTLVANFIRGMTSFLPRKFQLPIVALVLIMYVLLTGAAPATTRACVMALIATLGRMHGRASLALRSLAVAAVAMVLWNPPILLWDTGFIVSTLATFGLITLGRSLEELLHSVPETLKLREIVTATLSVQIFALPALLYYTGNFSIVSIPANVLALPALPWAMLFGFVAGLLNLLHPALAFIPMLIANALVRYMLGIAELAASIPYGSATVFSFPWWGAAIVYIPLTALAIHEYRRHAKE